MMRFNAPQYLLLLVVLVWFWRASMVSGSSRTPARTAIRCAIATLLILGMSQLQLKSGESPLSLVFVADVSDSMGAGTTTLRHVDALTAKLRAGDRAGLVIFAGAAAIERELSSSRAPFTGVTADVPGAATDIESALRLARTALPSDGLRRIVLISDGQQTRGDAMREAAFAASAGIPIDTVLPDDIGRAPMLTVTRLSAPAEVKVREPFALTAFVEGPPGSRGELAIDVDRGNSVRQEVRISPEGFATATFHEQRSDAGVYVYRAGIRALDTDSFAVDGEESSAGAVVTVAGEPRLLYVGAQPAPVDPILSSTFRVDRTSAAMLPRSAVGLAGYDAVILDDVPADAFDEAQISAIARHVEQLGAGLLVLGSARSLDAGVFPESVMGKLLPVDLRPRSGERAPSLALVVVFDKSGSMGDRVDGAAKIEYARQAIQKILDAVPATDAIGVIAFDVNPIPVAQLSTSSDAGAIAERLRLVQPSGSTAITPAVSLARQWLSTPQAARFSRRHVLLISDGRSSHADAERLRALVKEHPFELSIVALGGNSDRRFLTGLAEDTGGRAYFPEDLRKLPTMVAREAARVSGGRVLEETFTVRVSPHPIVKGIDAGSVPTLGGYVISAAKTTAETPLRSHLDDPILTSWRYGLGKVAVYTADLHSDWSARVRVWSQFSPLLTQTVRWLARPGNHQSLYPRFQQSGDGMRVVVDAYTAEGDYITLLDSQASMRTPSGETREIALTETHPGRYESELPITEKGAHLLTVTARSRDGAFDRRVLRGFYWSADQEQRTRGVNRALLSNVVQMTGGTVLHPDADPFSNRPPSYSDVRAWLSAAAFFLFLAEILAPVVSGLLKGISAHRVSSTGRQEAA